MLNLSNLHPAKGSQKKRKKVGRGGKRGTYSGRGMKGQRSRSGGKSGLKLRGLKQTLRRIPKNRGFKSSMPKFQPVNLKDLDKKFTDNDTITKRRLLSVGLITDAGGGVKILGDGQLKKKLNIKVDVISKSAKEAIEKAGGKVEPLKVKKIEEQSEKKEKKKVISKK